MAQIQTQEQRQEQHLQQTISQQQLLNAQLVELPLQQFIERVNTEMHDNPALEQQTDEPEFPDNTDFNDGPNTQDNADEDYDSQREREERQDALDAALESFGRDDEDLPVYAGNHYSAEEREDTPFGASETFYDTLLQQVSELELNDQERYVMEYLIRSLADDGLLRTPIDSIAEELAIYHNIDLSTAEIEKNLKRLQQLDPPGIGARDLQECLQLQVERKLADDTSNGAPQNKLDMDRLMLRVLEHHFDDFKNRRWDKLQKDLKVGSQLMEELTGELRHLNPRPGASMSETIGHSIQQITPDFIVDTQDDGTVTFSLNNSEIPQLQVSSSFAELLKEYQNNKDTMSRQMKEALLYTRQKVGAAQSFIDAIKMRQRSMTLTMKAIIQLQHPFFEEGDETLLRPMILKDVAEKTGLDISTISRVSNSKYAQTRWGTFPLRYFFSEGFTTQNGEELSTRVIKAVLREIIDEEDKRKPLADDVICKILAQKGYPIARRTVAKYREMLGIPIARLRKSN
ncbi:RNA polymerase factor sigma-54 [Xylanibacter brevis]|uniref:RNA polymerase factor sigma-54 n=1 Tax=Xylanibacter brevis TaxID=83231 RepID=UPI0004840DB3|nr:RNA polymerase factor sigma-54 [Xylanibacter brevis]